MQVINIIEMDGGVVRTINAYPIIIKHDDDFGIVPTPEEQRERIKDAAETHFKQLIKARINEMSQWDEDILSNILDETGYSEEEFLNDCVENGFFGYPHDNDIEFILQWATVFDLNIK